MSGLRLLFTFLYACALFAIGGEEASAQEQAVLERDSALLAEPRAGSQVVAQLKQGTSGEVIARKAAWVNLRTASGTGWLYSFNLRIAAAGAKPTIAAPRAPQSGRMTATIGIRGLDAEDLKAARYNDAQMRLLDSYSATKSDAESAAQASGLSPVRLEYLR